MQAASSIFTTAVITSVCLHKVICMYKLACMGSKLMAVL